MRHGVVSALLVEQKSARERRTSVFLRSLSKIGGLYQQTRQILYRKFHKYHRNVLRNSADSQTDLRRRGIG